MTSLRTKVGVVAFGVLAVGSVFSQLWWPGGDAFAQAPNISARRAGNDIVVESKALNSTFLVIAAAKGQKVGSRAAAGSLRIPVADISQFTVYELTPRYYCPGGGDCIPCGPTHVCINPPPPPPPPFLKVGSTYYHYLLPQSLPGQGPTP